MKLVASLRNKVKAKVKKSLEEAAAAGGREVNRKNVVQKVSSMTPLYAQLTFRRYLTSL